MFATLIEGKEYEGFTPGKEYEYYDQYSTANAQLTFFIKCDDNGKQRKMNERIFTSHFHGKYKNV